MAESKIVIAVICGTSREGRETEKAAQWVAGMGRKQPGVEIIWVDPRQVHLPPDGGPEDGRDPWYSETTARADAFFIVTPEYNHSIPGSLKRLIDSEYDNYKHKPVALAGASSGPWGGVRVCEALLHVCHRTGMVNIQPELYFPKVQELFDEDGKLVTEQAALYEAACQKVFDELVWFGRMLKTARSKG